MTTIHFRLVFFAILVSVICVANIAEPVSLGISAGWTDGTYRIAGGTAPWAIGFSALIWMFYALLMQENKLRVAGPLPGLVRRLFAFWLDFAMAIFAVTPIFGLIPLFSEWRRTGVFEWSFERNVAAKGDVALVAVTSVLLFSALIFYFAFPLLRGRPTPGACIAGYQVAIDDGEQMNLRRALSRTAAGLFAVGTTYIAPFISRDKKRGKFWLDTAFKTHAVRLK